MSTILLKLLGFNSSKDSKSRAAKLLDEIMYFLLSRIDSSAMKETQFCWPIYDAKQSQEFKSICLKILDKLHAQGKIKTQFKKFNYDITKCDANIVELCLYIMKSRTKQDQTYTIDELKQSVNRTIQDRLDLESQVKDQTEILKHEINMLQAKKDSFHPKVILDDATRDALLKEKRDLSRRFKEQLNTLQISMDRMNIANEHLEHIHEPKHVLGKVDLVFSKGETANDFQEYMTKESIEPFRDGKLDLVVFFRLYKLFLGKIVNALTSEIQLSGEVENFSDAVLKLKSLSDRFQELNSEMEKSLSDERGYIKKKQDALNQSYPMKESESRFVLANNGRAFFSHSNISVSGLLVPMLQISDCKELDDSAVKSIESSLGLMIKENRACLQPDEKSDIMKKCIYSSLTIASSQKSFVE